MHHNKVLELLVLVVIGAGLVPLHHRVEKLVIAKLTKPMPPNYTSPVAADDAAFTATIEEVITEELPLVTADTLSTEVEQKKTASAADATEADEK